MTELKELFKELLDKEKDSLTIGSAAKGGIIKVYFDSFNLVEAKKRVDNALEIRKYAQIRMEGV